MMVSISIIKYNVNIEGMQGSVPKPFIHPPQGSPGNADTVLTRGDTQLSDFQEQESEQTPSVNPQLVLKRST